MAKYQRRSLVPGPLRDKPEPERHTPPEPEVPRNPSLRAYMAMRPFRHANGYTSDAGGLHYLSFDDLRHLPKDSLDALEEVLDLAGLYPHAGNVVRLDSETARRRIARGETEIILLDSELDALRKLLVEPPAEPKRRKCR